MGRGAPDLAETGVVHLTGDLDAMARAAHEARRGIVPVQPMLIVGQQSVADPSRAPAGGHTLWIETHVPPVPRATGSWAKSKDAFLDVIMDRLEEHAPGLAARVVGTAVRTPQDLQDENPNLVGGDLGAGSSASTSSWCSGPCRGGSATPRRSRASTCAPPRPTPAAGYTAWPGATVRGAVLADRRRHRI